MVVDEIPPDERGPHLFARALRCLWASGAFAGNAELQLEIAAAHSLIR